MEFFWQEYWSGLPCHPPEALTHPGIEPVPPMSPALASSFFTISTIWEIQLKGHISRIHPIQRMESKYIRKKKIESQVKYRRFNSHVIEVQPGEVK